jgi:hypothetical protein
MNNRPAHILFFAMLAAVFSCGKPEVPESENDEPGNPDISAFEKYVIKKGNHFAEQSRVVVLSGNGVNCKVMFDSTAVYSTTAANNQGDVNKLIGFSDCNTDHHENSARLGWAWSGKELVVYVYAYSNGIRAIRKLSTVDIRKIFSCSVTAGENQYYFTVAGKTDSLARHCRGGTFSRYKLFPYFGGDETAPHDINIFIKEE